MLKRLTTNRWLHFAFLIGLLVYLVYGIAPDNAIRERLQFIVFDNYLTSNPRQTTGDVYVVDIDDESLKQIGQWPWPRDKLGKLIQNINRSGAKVIAFDGVLAEPDRTSGANFLQRLGDEKSQKLQSEYPELAIDNDEQLAGIIKQEGNFIAGFSHGIDEQAPAIKQSFLAKKDVRGHLLDHAFRFQNTARFLNPLEDASAGNGSFMAAPEQDNVIRKTPMILTDSNDLYPSLNLETIRLFQSNQGTPFPKIKINPSFSKFTAQTLMALEIGDYKIPLSYSGDIWIYYRDFIAAKDQYYLPAYQLFDRPLSDNRLEGKIVYIASSAEGLKDVRATTIGFIPGVEIHVNATEQILSNQYLTRPLTVFEAEGYFIIGFGILLIILVPLLGIIPILLITGGLIMGAFWVSYYAFMNEGLLIDPVYPSLSLGLLFILANILNYMRSEADRRQVRTAFGHYISQDFMKELTKNPDKLKLGGEIRELSVMFTDIRKFTSICEGMAPEDIIQLMNDFLTPMSDLVMQNRGTIDKYMGDAMMAFWNAPLDDENHARHACQSALGMQAALDPINAALKEQGRNLHLQAGIGINTGPCAVGNMGSRQRFAYSALGDTVNLAARLEGQTKLYGVGTLIGETTYNDVKDFACLEVDLIQVIGKEKVERIFALLGDEDLAAQENFQALRSAHASMMKTYQAGDFEEATTHLKSCKEYEGQFHLKTLYELYEQRLLDLKTQTPVDWNGVFVAQSK